MIVLPVSVPFGKKRNNLLTVSSQFVAMKLYLSINIEVNWTLFPPQPSKWFIIFSFWIKRTVPFVVPTYNWLFYSVIGHGLYGDVENEKLKDRFKLNTWITVKR